MRIADTILPQFDYETATTRKVLARLPEDQLEWAPHPKSMPLGRLAGHLAEIPGWVGPTLQASELDMNPPGGKAYERLVATDRASLLATFDRFVAAAKSTIAATEDPVFFEDWSLKNGGQVFFTQPKIAVLRTFIISHSIHHRAQLCVYYRLLDIPVPSVYGPSADEQM